MSKPGTGSSPSPPAGAHAALQEKQQPQHAKRKVAASDISRMDSARIRSAFLLFPSPERSLRMNSSQAKRAPPATTTAAQMQQQHAPTPDKASDAPPPSSPARRWASSSESPPIPAVALFQEGGETTSYYCRRTSLTEGHRRTAWSTCRQRGLRDSLLVLVLGKTILSVSALVVRLVRLCVEADNECIPSPILCPHFMATVVGCCDIIFGPRSCLLVPNSSFQAISARRLMSIPSTSATHRRMPLSRPQMPQALVEQRLLLFPCPWSHQQIEGREGQRE